MLFHFSLSFFYDAISILDHVATNYGMVDELERKGNFHGMMEVLSRHLPGWTEKNHEVLGQNSQCGTKIRTKHLPSTNLDNYHYAKLLRNTVFGISIFTLLNTVCMRCERVSASVHSKASVMVLLSQIW